MIKLTIILIVIYAVMDFFTGVYVGTLDPISKILLSRNKMTPRQQLWFALVGLMRILCWIFGAISVIMLVLRL